MQKIIWIPLLLITIALILIISCNVSAQTEPPENGNWIISDSTTKSNSIIVLNGNLTILNGGILTLNNVTLIIDSTIDGQYEINVTKDGEFYLHNSTITTNDTTTTVMHHFDGYTDHTTYGLTYKFKTFGKAIIDNCNISYTWGYWPSSFEYKKNSGIQIYSDDVTISNCSIWKSQMLGIYCDSSSPTIENNEFHDLDTGIWCRSSVPLIQNNIFSSINFHGIVFYNNSSGYALNNKISNNSGAGISTIFSSPIIQSNYIYGPGINCQSSSPLIYSNEIINTGGGITIGKNSSPQIINNYINSQYDIDCGESTPYISNNILTGWSVNSCGISIVKNSKATIVNNTIFSMTTWGIIVEYSSAFIENNTIFECNEGVRSGFSNVTIIRNNILNSTFGVLVFEEQRSGFKKPGTIVEVIGNTFEGNVYGVKTTEASDRWGPVYISNVTIENNSISNNEFGIANEKPYNPIINNNTLFDNKIAVIGYEDTETTLINCSIVNSERFDFKLMGNTKVILFDTDYNQDKVEFGDDISFIAKSRYLTIHIVNESGAPITGANVSVVDSEGNEIYNSSNCDSKIKNLLCFQIKHRKNVINSNATHLIFIEKNGMLNTTIVIMEDDQNVTVILKTYAAHEQPPNEELDLTLILILLIVTILVLISIIIIFIKKKKSI